MKRNTLNYAIDAATVLALVGVAGTGILLEFVLPPRSGSATLFALDRHEWGDIHFWFTWAFGGVLLVHMILHWRWVCTMSMRVVSRGRWRSSNSRWKRSLAGIGLIVLLAGGGTGMVYAARAAVEPGTRQGRNNQARLVAERGDAATQAAGEIQQRRQRRRGR